MSSPKKSQHLRRPRYAVSLRQIFFAAILIGASGCGGGSSTPNTPPQSVTVSVSSSSSNVLLGNTQQFTAAVTGTPNTAVNWSVNNVAGGNATIGTITNAGLYTAPADLPSPASVTVQATSQADSSASGSASLKITSDIVISVTTVPAGVQSVTAGASLQLQASIASAGHPDQAVNWSVNGVANGNSTVGSISVNGTDTATYTAPASLSSPLSVTVSAVSVADTAKQNSVALQDILVALSVTSVSNTSPIPLTPLYISTSGLNPNSSVTVQFSNNAGFLVSQQPTRVAPDGTVVAATPLYLDPSSGQIGPGSVSLVLSQGNTSSAPVTLNIQDLPSVSSYGTQLGQISHAFLTYSQMRTARRLGEFQAFQELPGNTIATSQPQASLQAFLTALIEARNDGDRVSLNNSLVISGGTLSNGTAIQFDQNSLDMMDRVFGLYLTQFSSIYSATATPAVLKANSMSARGFSGRRSKHALRIRPFIVSPEQASTGGLSAVLNYITAAGNLTALTQAYSDGTAKDATTFDKVLAISNGASALYGLATVGGTVGQAVAGAAFGALLSGVSLLNHTGMELGDLAFIMVASRNGGDPAVLQEAQNDLNNNSHAAAIDAIQTELNLAAVGGAFGSFGNGVVGSFLAVENAGGQIALQSAGFITGAYGCVTSSSGPCYTAIENTALNLGSEVINIFTSNSQGFAEVSGTANISNSQGSTLAADTGIAISSFDVSSSDMTALADPNGNYDLFVPLQAANTNYGLLTVTAFDPVSGLVLASSPIDLTSLTTTAPMQLPTLQGGCTDTDAGNPDSDDPDCD